MTFRLIDKIYLNTEFNLKIQIKILFTHLLNILSSYYVPGIVPDMASDLMSFPFPCSKENLRQFAIIIQYNKCEV